MIRIDVRSAKDEVIESAQADPEFNPVLQGIDKVAFPILGHLDPYGDTILNRLQVESLISEIDRITMGEAGMISEDFATSLRELGEKCLRKPHRFMWFIGD